MSHALHNPEPPRWTLAEALGQAAADLTQQPLPPALEARVLAATALARTAAPAPRRLHWGLAATACVVLLSALLLLLRPGTPDGIDVSDWRALGFVAVAPAERWPTTATAWVVDTEVPGARLAALGLPYDPARAAEPQRAELLLHPSGEVLAVRFLP